MIKKLIRQIVRPRYEKIKLFSSGKQRTVISEPTLPKNNNDCSVEEINNCASAKRNAFKAKRANAVTTIDVHQLQFVVQEYEFDDDIFAHFSNQCQPTERTGH